MSIYDIELEKMNGEKVKLDVYKGKTILIVNTASKCGFTPQFEELEMLHKKYKDSGLEILGFPCNQFLRQDPGSNDEILSFCQLNYGVTFPMFNKLKVKGKDINPLYKYLIENTPVRPLKNVKWNFEKFLVDRKGTIVNRYASSVKPSDIEDELKELL